MERIAEGDDEDVTAGGAAGDGTELDGLMEVEQVQRLDTGQEPPPMVFALDAPPITAQDLDIIKLTALFTARRGRAFLASLSMREGRNYQFEFLHPTHALFPYFNALVEQYTKILMPPKETLDHIAEIAAPAGRSKTLAVARERAKWERTRREREKRRADDREAEKSSFLSALL